MNEDGRSTQILDSIDDKMKDKNEVDKTNMCLFSPRMDSSSLGTQTPVSLY